MKDKSASLLHQGRAQNQIVHQVHKTPAHRFTIQLTGTDKLLNGVEMLAGINGSHRDRLHPASLRVPLKIGEHIRLRPIIHAFRRVDRKGFLANLLAESLKVLPVQPAFLQRRA
jgi:hypothetical protein